MAFEDIKSVIYHGIRSCLEIHLSATEEQSSARKRIVTCGIANKGQLKWNFIDILI